MSFFEELKRRNVFRVAIGYVITAWLLLQVVDLVLENINAPDWVMQVFMLALAIGFPLAVFFAWAFEMTPEGVKRESEVDRSQSIAPQTGQKLNRTIILVLVLAVAFLLYKQLGNQSQAPVVITESEQASETLSALPELTETGPVTIAVLPFVNMSSDPEQEYFSDGITEEILNRLAKVSELQVAARTSVFTFKGQHQDIRQIGEMLGVGNILEGSVRRDGEQVRITAQLIRASDGFHLWSETYDRKLENIFAIQDDIASKIAVALQISLGITENQAATGVKTVDPQVYDLYLRARALHRHRGVGVIEALELFQQALDIDPEFAPAWAGLAHSYDVVEFYVSDQVLAEIGDFRTKSTSAAQQALQLDPELATALHAMGNNLWVQGEWAQAQEYYERALQLDPDSADIMEDYSQMLSYALQLEAGRKVGERMVTLDPYVPVFLNALMNQYNAIGEYEKRDAGIRSMTEHNPDFRYTYVWNIERLFELGQIDELHEYIDQIDLSNWATAKSLHAAIDWMVNAEQTPDDEILTVLSIRPGFAMLAKRPDIFFETIKNLSNGRKFPSILTILNPRMPADETRQVRESPHTKALVEEMRLPEYWRKVGWPDMCSPIGEDDFECH
jgi:TolB-like protein